MEKEPLFWADQKAAEIAGRKKFHYIDEKIPNFDEYVIKTSASISGVLHIGRLSDTIRSESVYKALCDGGYKAELIWVAEDMDPLRKIPEGVPEKFAAYIGMPVTSAPDPWGCHASYAEHHISEYLEVIDEFLAGKIRKYSMKEEYRKGSFAPYIKSMLESIEKIREIQNKYREKPLSSSWSPWAPVCRNCGKIITPKVVGVSDGIVTYRCEDYVFEESAAKGCGYEGENNPLKDEGKMMWKGEWAMQWARWKVASEGAGKEYVVPSSAWWVNGEIAERVLGFPMPVPIFYEHLMIDGQKMSASLGNVVYPKDWLSVAQPELLRFFYNKKLMKTRSFSWRELPNLYDDYDSHALNYFEKKPAGSEKEVKHMKRLYEVSQLEEIKKPLHLSFSNAAMISQFFTDEKSIVESLKRLKAYDSQKEKMLMQRIELAGNWVKKYAPEEMKISFDVDVKGVGAKLNEAQKKFLKALAAWMEGERTPEEIHERIYVLAKELSIQPKEAFQVVYLSIIGTPTGPKAGAFLASLDKDWVIKRLEEVSAV